MTKRKTKSLTYPATLVVKYEEDGDTGYFLASSKIADLAEQGEKIKVGVYYLVEVRTLVAEPELLD